MYENSMSIVWLNHKRHRHFIDCTISCSDTPFKSTSKDLLGKEVVHFDYTSSSWEDFCNRLKAIPTKYNYDLVKKLKSAIKSYLKGTAESVQIVFKSTSDLRYYLLFDFESKCV